MWIVSGLGWVVNGFCVVCYQFGGGVLGYLSSVHYKNSKLCTLIERFFLLNNMYVLTKGQNIK